MKTSALHSSLSFTKVYNYLTYGSHGVNEEKYQKSYVIPEFMFLTVWSRSSQLLVSLLQDDLCLDVLEEINMKSLHRQFFKSLSSSVYVIDLYKFLRKKRSSEWEKMRKKSHLLVKKDGCSKEHTCHLLKQANTKSLTDGHAAEETDNGGVIPICNRKQICVHQVIPPEGYYIWSM